MTMRELLEISKESDTIICSKNCYLIFMSKNLYSEHLITDIATFFCNYLSQEILLILNDRSTLPDTGISYTNLFGCYKFF